MTKYLLAGAAAFAMMTGVAFAEESSTTTRSMTTSPVPAVGSYKSSETHRGIHRDNRYAIHMKRSFHNGEHGWKASSRMRSVMPDGSRSTYRVKETGPFSGSTVEKKTTTTIDR
jgi:hypothetical protein